MTAAQGPVLQPTTTARPWPTRMVRLAALATPHGAVRDRYRQEFLAELCDLPAAAQARHATHILTHSLALRSAVRGASTSPLENAMAGQRKPLLCRLNLRHPWENAHTADGQRFIRCRLCFKEKDNSANWQSFAGGGA